MSTLFAENMDEHKDDEAEEKTEEDIFASWENRIASSLHGLRTRASGARRWRCCAATKPCGVGIGAICREPKDASTSSQVSGLAV